MKFYEEKSTHHRFKLLRLFFILSGMIAWQFFSQRRMPRATANTQPVTKATFQPFDLTGIAVVKKGKVNQYSNYGGTSANPNVAGSRYCFCRMIKQTMFFFLIARQ